MLLLVPACSTLRSTGSSARVSTAADGRPMLIERQVAPPSSERNTPPGLPGLPMPPAYSTSGAAGSTISARRSALAGMPVSARVQVAAPSVDL